MSKPGTDDLLAVRSVPEVRPSLHLRLAEPPVRVGVEIGEVVQVQSSVRLERRGGTARRPDSEGDLQPGRQLWLLERAVPVEVKQGPFDPFEKRRHFGGLKRQLAQRPRGRLQPKPLGCGCRVAERSREIVLELASVLKRHRRQTGELRLVKILIAVSIDNAEELAGRLTG